MLCQPSTMTTYAKHPYQCSAPAVWNSLQKTVKSDSVTVFKSRLKTFLFSQALSSRFSVVHCLAPAPMKLRPYGAIQIRLLLLLFIIIITPQGSTYRIQYKTAKR